MGYRTTKTVHYRLPVSIEWKIEDDRLLVFVKGADGKPADGFVEFSNQKKELVNGLAVFKAGEGLVKYLGSEKYLPAKAEVKETFNFLPVIATIFAASAILALKFKHKRILKVEILKEHPELPNVWDVGEVVEIRAEAKNKRVKVIFNGKTVQGEGKVRARFKFSKFGIKKISVEAISDGKIVDRAEVTLRIAPYREGIVEVFGLFCKYAESKGIDTKGRTAREIMDLLGIKDSELLTLFELSKYRKRDFTREDFINAFYDYLSLRGKNV